MKPRAASAFINQVLAYSLAMLVFTGSIGLGTVWLRHEISVVANRNQSLQDRLALVQRHIDDATARIAAAQSTENLLRLDARWHLGLVRPQPDQTKFVPGDVGLWFAARRNRDAFTVDPLPTVQHRPETR